MYFVSCSFFLIFVQTRRAYDSAMRKSQHRFKKAIERHEGASPEINPGILDLPGKNLKFKAKNAALALAKSRLFNEKIHFFSVKIDVI